MKVEGIQNTRAVLGSLIERNHVRVSSRWIDELAIKLESKITLSSAGPKINSSDGEHDLLSFVVALARNERAEIADEKSNPAINPWLKGHQNMTHQHRIERDDPQRAAMLQREAAKIDAAGDPENPFSRAGLNITRQHLLLRTDPERAAYLAAQAGVQI